MLRRDNPMMPDHDSDEDKKPQEYHDDNQEQNFNFVQFDQEYGDDGFKTTQSYYVSPLTEIQEMEFTNQDYVQDIFIDGSKFEKSQNNFKYDYVLSDMGINPDPDLDDCFDTSSPKKITAVLSKYERNRRKLGEICCIAFQKQIIAVGFSSSCIMLWQNTNAAEPSNEKLVTIPNDLGSLSCLDFHFDGQMLVCGCSSGEIVFIDVQRGIVVQHFPNIHKADILAIRLIHRVKEEFLVTISCDVNGIGQLVNYKKGFFNYDVVPQPLTKQTKYPCNTLQVLHPEIQDTFFGSPVNGTQDQANTINRIVAVMNIEKLWIICIRMKKQTGPEMFILFEYDCPFTVARLDSLSSCCSFGEGFVRNNKSQDVANKLILMCCWGSKLFHVDLSEQINFNELNLSEYENLPIAQDLFQVSTFIDFRTRLLSCNFLESSLCLVTSKFKGVFLINTTNLLNFKEDRNYLELNAINFKHRINYRGREVKLANNVLLTAIRKFKRAVRSTYILKRKYQDDTSSINYGQAFASCVSRDCHNIAALHEGGVSMASIADWQKSMSSFYQQGEWAVGMHYVLGIYRGTNRYVTRFLKYSLEQRRQLIDRSIHDIANKYFKMIMDCIMEGNSRMEDAAQQLRIDKDVDQHHHHQQYVSEQIHSYKTLFAVLIEFLILTDSHELLFLELMPITETLLQDGKTFFLECLEPFLSSKKLTYIPEGVLISIIDYYRTRKHMDLIQKLVFSLNHKLIDTVHLIQVCLKFGLLKSLVVICERGDTEEFLTPIIKIWCYVLVYMQKDEIEKAQYFLLRALSYLQMALKRKLITGQPLPEEKFEEVVREISKWMFNSDNLHKLLLIEPAPTFEVVQLFFNPEVSTILNKINLFKGNIHIVDWVTCNQETNAARIMGLIQDLVVQIIDQFDAKQSINDSVTTMADSFDEPDMVRRSASVFDDPLYKSIVEAQSDPISKVESQSEKDVMMSYTVFQVRVFLSKNIALDNSRVILCLSYILKNLRALDQLYLIELVGHLSYSEKQDIKKWNDQSEVMSYMKSEYLVGVIKAIVDNNPSDSDLHELKELVYLADLTLLSTTCIELAQLKGEYKRAFDLYLTSKNNFIRSRIFEWIWRTMERLERSKLMMHHFEVMKVYLLQKLTDLIKINSESTRDLISRYHKDSEYQVIHKLDAYPALQLQYVENVLKNEREAGRRIQSDMLRLYVGLLGSLAPHKLLKELMSNNEYPLEVVLPICRQYHIDEATAYVLERSGSIAEAVDIHVHMLRKLTSTLAKDAQNEHDQSTKKATKSIFTSLFQKINKSYSQEMMQQQASKVFLEKVRPILRVCELNVDPFDEIWYVLLDNIIDIRDNLLMKGEAHAFLRNLCTQQVCAIIATIAKSRDLEILLEKLQTRYACLDLGQLKMTFQEIITSYIYEQNVLSNWHGVIRDDRVNKIQGLLDGYRQAVSSSGFCSQCNIEVNIEGEYSTDTSPPDGAIVFRCGHAYHRGCVVEQQNIFLCQMCCQRDESFAYNLLFSNPKISLDKLTENLKKRIQLLDKDEIKHEDEQQKNLEAMMSIENVIFIQKVSKECEAKRKRRTNKMGYFDRKKANHIYLVESQSEELIKEMRKQ